MFAILITHFFALALPGADFVLTIRTALKNGFKSSTLVAIGITFGILCWIIFVVLGLKTTFEHFPFLSNFLTIFSICYLFYLSFIIFKNAGYTNLTEQKQQTTNHFLLGLITNLANPKAIFYFISIFSNFISKQNLENIILISALIIFESLIFFIILGKIFCTQKAINLFKKYNKFIDYLSAFIFFIFAILIIIGG